MTDGLWAASRRPLTVGLTASITFVAAEALAVVTVMPLVARDLHGLSLYGFVFSAFMLGTMIGIVAAGRAADRRGPAIPYVTGLILFGSGLVIAGLAPSMAVLVAGRAFQGLGAGAVPAVAYVAIGRSLPDRLRARMMAVLSTAWVVPGLAGPALSAEVARAFGWRWVFLGLIPFIALAGSLAIPALVRLGPTASEPAGSPGGERDNKPASEPAGSPGGERDNTDGHRLIDGVGVAAAAGMVLAGLTLAAGGGQASGSQASGAAHRAHAAHGLPGPWPVLAGGVLVLAGCLLGPRTLRRLLPAGTLSARRGLPATIASRGLLTFCFFGADAFVTLTITIIRHRSPVFAGVAVTGSTLAWTAGAWIQARLNSRWEARRLVRLGLTVVIVGIAGLGLLLSGHVPAATGIAAWTVAGLGMGMCYAPISLLMLREAPAGREGWASAALNLADVLGSALGIGLGGTAVSAAAGLGLPIAAGVAVAFALAATAGIAALAISPRLPASRGAVARQEVPADQELPCAGRPVSPGGRSARPRPP